MDKRPKVKSISRSRVRLRQAVNVPITVLELALFEGLRF